VSSSTRSRDPGWPLEPTERTEAPESVGKSGTSATPASDSEKRPEARGSESDSASEVRPEAPGAAEAAAPSVPHPGLALWVATVGGVGFGPWAPGTWGALVAVVAFALGLEGIGLPLYLLCTVIVSAVGVWASNAVEVWFGRSDDGRIVIDELAGQLITLLPIVALHGLPLGVLRVPGLESLVGSGIDVWWLLVVTAFVAFRWFDIRKPGPVDWAEKNYKGGVGVMADDIVAGLLGACVVTLPAFAVVVARLRAAVEGLPG